MLTGNKGEWSEIYALFKLLGDKELYLGDKELKKVQGVVYPVLKILRSEINGNFEYSIQDNIVFITGNSETLRIPIVIFKENALLLLRKIKESTKRTFSVQEIEEFMRSINCISLKASSSAKTDITIVVHDQRINQQPTLGFSIKSQLGSPSTLLNAGKTTNFIYKITNINITDISIDQINNINTKSKIRDRVAKILEKEGKFEFLRTEKQIFSNNLVLIDSLLPEILSQIILKFYSGNILRLVDLVERVSDKNPLNFDTANKHQFYEYKIKRFLTDIALGMMPSKVWTGEYDTTGGYLIIKENGSILCYHIYNRNQFENYLLNNTKLETASSSRHNFGEIYREKEQLFFKLNLQIRFIN